MHAPACGPRIDIPLRISITPSVDRSACPAASWSVTASAPPACSSRRTHTKSPSHSWTRFRLRPSLSLECALLLITTASVPHGIASITVSTIAMTCVLRSWSHAAQPRTVHAAGSLAFNPRPHIVDSPLMPRGPNCPRSKGRNVRQSVWHAAIAEPADDSGNEAARGAHAPADRVDGAHSPTHDCRHAFRLVSIACALRRRLRASIAGLVAVVGANAEAALGMRPAQRS